MKKDGLTMVIMTTHDRNQADRLADRVQIMKEGRIEETGEGFKTR
jgi:ABC-type sulfate/molybdate transport systems ATPase subunit